MSSESKQVEDMIAKVVLPIEENGAIDISPQAVCNIVYKNINPGTGTPMLVTYLTKLQILVQVRAFLTKRHDPIKTVLAKIEDQVEIEFGNKLQPYYPATRNSERRYVLRSELTEPERARMVSRLRQAGHGYLRHADALEAEGEHVSMPA